VPDLTATIGARIAALGVEVHDLRGRLPTADPARVAPYPRAAAGERLYTGVHYTAARRGVRDLAGDIEGWRRHAAYHVEHHGWPGLAYRFGVGLSGRVFLLGDVEAAGYHAYGSNRNGVGVAGDLLDEAPTPALLRGLGATLAVLHQQTPELPGLVRERTFGHCELGFLDGRNATTPCPGPLLPFVRAYRAGEVVAALPATATDPREMLERAWWADRLRLGDKVVSGLLTRPWGDGVNAAKPVLVCERGVLLVAGGSVHDVTDRLRDDLVTYLERDGSLVAYR
jgi:hypothetical protein